MSKLLTSGENKKLRICVSLIYYIYVCVCVCGTVHAYSFVVFA